MPDTPDPIIPEEAIAGEMKCILNLICLKNSKRILYS
jgi:hypothetical protein